LTSTPTKKNPITMLLVKIKLMLVMQSHRLSMKGVQGQGVFSTGKTFSRINGDTAADRNIIHCLWLPKERIDLVELYPYKRIFDEGLVSVMVGHLEILA
jgi:beta-glucosidase-like glycosyl hydrolase